MSQILAGYRPDKLPFLRVFSPMLSTLCTSRKPASITSTIFTIHA